jgi:molybdopterin converting factor small subunit
MAWVSSVDARVRELTGGQARFEVPAATVRGLLSALEARWPGLGAHVEADMALAIDGEIHHDALGEPLSADAEVVLIPRIGGG